LVDGKWLSEGKRSDVQPCSPAYSGGLIVAARDAVNQPRCGDACDVDLPLSDDLDAKELIKLVTYNQLVSAQNVSALRPRKALSQAPSSTGLKQSAAKASSQRGSRVSLKGLVNVPKPRALAQLRPASSRDTSVPRRGASPASLSSKDALKTHLRSTPTVSSKAPVQSAPAMLTCPYCPKQCPTQVGLSVHLTRWCKQNPSGAPQSLGSRRVPTVSQASKASMQAASRFPRRGDHKAEPLVQSTPAVVRRGTTAPRASAVVRPSAVESRRGSKASSQKALPTPVQLAFPGSSKRAASVSLQSNPAMAPSAKPLSQSASSASSILRRDGRL
jgi:hypothetical protein